LKVPLQFPSCPHLRKKAAVGGGEAEKNCFTAAGIIEVVLPKRGCAMMKKFLLLTAPLALLFAATPPAPAQEAYSQVVGFVKIPIAGPGGLSLISLTQLSGNAESVNIQDAIQNLEELNARSASTSAWDNTDKLTIWTGSGYTRYGLFQPASGDRYWATEDAALWRGRGGVPPMADVEVMRGYALWYETGATGTEGKTVVISGEVATDTVFDVEVRGSLEILSYPFASAINLQNLHVAGAQGQPVGSSAWNNADKLVVWTGSGYIRYGLFHPISGNPYWAAEDAALWRGRGGVPAAADVQIDLGKGFWFESPAGAKILTLSRNYTVE